MLQALLLAALVAAPLGSAALFVPARLVDRERYSKAEQALLRLRELFGEHNTFVELQHNLVQGDTQRVARLAQLAEQLGLPIVATRGPQLEAPFLDGQNALFCPPMDPAAKNATAPAAHAAMPATDTPRSDPAGS